MSEIVQKVQGGEGICEQIEYVSSSHLTTDYSDTTKYNYRLTISANTIAQALKKYKYLVITADYPYSSGGSSGNFTFLCRVVPVGVLSNPFFATKETEASGSSIILMASSGSFLLDVVDATHTQAGIVGRLYGIY